MILLSPCLLIFYQYFKNFFEMKIDINRVILTLCPVYWIFWKLPLGCDKDGHFSFTQRSCQSGLNRTNLQMLTTYTMWTVNDEAAGNWPTGNRMMVRTVILVCNLVFWLRTWWKPTAAAGFPAAPLLIVQTVHLDAMFYFLLKVDLHVLFKYDAE